MSFYTALTGLNGAQSEISTISNNIANVSTTGFKSSTAEFGDIFATSPLQNATSAVGSGTTLKSIKQQFTQGNIESTQNTLDLAISGQGFFALKPSLTSNQTVYSRNGSFSVNNNRYVVDDQGQYLQVFPVNSDGSVTSTGIDSATNLQLPLSSGLPKATSAIQLGLNLPANATVIPQSSTYTASNPYVFNRNDPSTYNQSTSITIYDSLGNPTIATLYYVKTSNSTSADPTNKWETYVYVGDQELNPALITSKDSQNQTIYTNKFGQTTTNPAASDPSFIANQPSPLYYQDQQTNQTSSTPAAVQGVPQSISGFDFGSTDANQVTIVTDPSQYSQTREGGNTSTTSPFWGTDMFSISVDGSAPKSISINAGSYTGDQLAAEMTRAVNAAYSDQRYYKITDTYRNPGGTVVAGNDTLNINLSQTAADGSTVSLNPPLEIDLLGTAGAAGTPPVDGVSQQLSSLNLTRDQLISLAQTKVNEALNARASEFGQEPNWVNSTNPPIKVGFDIATNSLTFNVDPAQLGPNASLPSNRYQTIQVSNPTSATNDLGIPPLSGNVTATIGTNAWTGQPAIADGDPITPSADQRTGITVTYNKDTRQFDFSSGSTGEASSIQVSRATLATSNDVQSQINSYDFSHLSLAAGQSITLESNGQSFTYTTPVYVDPSISYPATANSTITVGTPPQNVPAISPDDFINNLTQAFPVSFSQTAEQTVGSPTQAEVQTFTPYGNLLSGDQFQFQFQAGPDNTPLANLATINVGPLPTFTASTSTADRVSALKTAMNTAISNYVATYNAANPTKPITTSQLPTVGISSTGGIEITYQSNGSISTLASLKQTVRGTADGATLQQPIPLADQTLTTSPAVVSQQGSAQIPEIQEMTLEPINIGASVAINAGDTFTVSIPKSDGSVLTKTVTLTAGGIAGLKSALNKDADISALVSFDASSTTNKLSMTYNSKGPITGAFTLIQSGIESASSGLASLTALTGTNWTPGTYTNVPLLDSTGKGSGATANIVVGTNGSISSASIVTAGTGYAAGDAITLDMTSPNAPVPLDAALGTVTLSGSGFAPGTYTNVSLTDSTGNGTGATATITVDPTGHIQTTTVTTGGVNYSNASQLTANLPTTTTGLSLSSIRGTGTAAASAVTGGDALPTGTNTKTYSNVPLLDAAGHGTGATATVTVAAGGGITLSNITPGTGYAIGDNLTFDMSSYPNGLDLSRYSMTVQSPLATVTTTASSTSSTLTSETTTFSATVGTLNSASQTVRQNAIGPYSIALASGTNRMEIVGNADGEPFSVNVLANGVPQTVEPQGAAGSKTRSGIQIGQAMATATNTSKMFSGTNELLGIGSTYNVTSVAGTGLASTAAVANGATATIPMNQTFVLTQNESQMTFTIDGITGTISLPLQSYTGDTLAAAIQQRINQIEDPATGRLVSGAKVAYDVTNNRLVFTSGTTGSSSQVNVVGAANLGLSNVTQTAGTVPQITNLTQATDANGNALYVDANGNITTVKPVTKQQNWWPLYLTPGELTFDTSGKLKSPSQGMVYSPFDPGNGANPLNLNINYGAQSTQYNQAFSVNSLTQDGYPSGQLDSLAIDSSGTVRADYTNGQTQALGKIILANFANPNGLKQVGNTDYVASTNSGTPTYGQGGSDGFGSIQSGSLETSNVDVTQELTNLITAQQYFSANSKVIETETQLTDKIIQIQG